jgi:hypothetical protein
VKVFSSWAQFVVSIAGKGTTFAQRVATDDSNLNRGEPGMKPSILWLLPLMFAVGCEIQLPPSAKGPADVVPETKTGSYEDAEPMGTNAMAAHMNHMNEQMVQQLGETDENYEKRFIDMMIPHHEGAVAMAKHAMQHSQREELKQMAQKMIDDQQREIEQLKELRAEWYESAE